MTRPSWDEVWMATADAVAERSLCVRAQVGAVIVTNDNRVQAASYNGPPPGFSHLDRKCNFWCDRASAAPTDLHPEYHDCPSTHAEMSALARSPRSEGATIYITGACCMSCAKVIPQTGITRVMHRVAFSDMHRDPEKVEAFLRACGVEVHRAS